MHIIIICLTVLPLHILCLTNNIFSQPEPECLVTCMQGDEGTCCTAVSDINSAAPDDACCGIGFSGSCDREGDLRCGVFDESGCF